MAGVAAKRESCVLAGCTGAPAPAQELLLGFCGRALSTHSRNGAAGPAAKGSTQAWGRLGEAGGELAEQRGRNPGDRALLGGVLHPEQGPCRLCGEGGQGLSGRRYGAV